MQRNINLRYGSRQIIALYTLFIVHLFSSGAIAQTPELVPQTAHTGAISALAFSRDGKRLASGSKDNTIKLWDPSSGLEIRTLKEKPVSESFSEGERRTFDSLANGVNFVAFGETNRLVSGIGFDTVRVWDTATGDILSTLRTQDDMIGAYALSADGKILVCRAHTAVEAWDLDKKLLLWKTEVSVLGESVIAISADGRIAASPTEMGEITLWEARTGKEIRKIKTRLAQISAITLSADGKKLAVSDCKPMPGFDLDKINIYTMYAAALKKIKLWDIKIQIWDVATGRVMQSITAHRDIVHALVFSGDGNLLASGSEA